MFILWAGFIGSLAFIAKALMGPRLGILPFVGGVLGSALASFSFAILAVEVANVSDLMVLGLAGPIGWLGGDVLANLGRRYVADLTPPSPSPPRAPRADG